MSLLNSDETEVRRIGFGNTQNLSESIRVAEHMGSKLIPCGTSPEELWGGKLMLLSMLS